MTPFSWTGHRTPQTPAPGVPRRDAEHDGRPSPSSGIVRASRAPGMGFEHDLLIALMMAVVLAATILLHR